MSKDKVRVGFVGCGHHATHKIYPALRYAPIELVAVCDLDPQKAERNRRNFGAERAYTDYQDMMDKEKLDAVMAVVNAEVHCKVALDALQRGLHVWTDKPPAASVADLQGLAEARRKAGKRHEVGFQNPTSAGDST